MAACSSDGTSQLCYGSSLFSLWWVRSSPSCLRACLQAWSSLRCCNGQTCAVEAHTAPHEDLIVSRLIFLAARSFWVILGFQKGRKSRWFLRSPWITPELHWSAEELGPDVGHSCDAPVGVICGMKMSLIAEDWRQLCFVCDSSQRYVHMLELNTIILQKV